MGMAGATVLRGPMGFGKSSRLHTSKILRLSGDLPLIIEIVDSEEKINAFLPILDRMMGGGLVTLEKARVLHYRTGGAPDPGSRVRAAADPARPASVCDDVDRLRPEPGPAPRTLPGTAALVGALLLVAAVFSAAWPLSVKFLNDRITPAGDPRFPVGTLVPTPLLSLKDRHFEMLLQRHPDVAESLRRDSAVPFGGRPGPGNGAGGPVTPVEPPEPAPNHPHNKGCAPRQTLIVVRG